MRLGVILLRDQPEPCVSEIKQFLPVLVKNNLDPAGMSILNNDPHAELGMNHAVVALERRFGDIHIGFLRVQSTGFPRDYRALSSNTVFIVDDFKPHGTKGEIDGFHSKADKLIRGVGNQAGRGRLQADLKQRTAYHARGFVLATGEDIPRGQSLRARMTVASLSRDATNPRQGDIDLNHLTALQAHARAGTLARAMAGFIRWLAPQLDTLKQILPEGIRNRRDQAAHQGMKGHSRAPSDFASLTAGIGALARFALESGTLSETEARAFEARCGKALFGLMEDQAEHQASQDDVSRFLSLLASALLSGRCHVFDLESVGDQGGKGVPHGPMKNVRAFGWQQDTRGEYHPQGPCVGYMEGETLYLDGDAAFAAVTSYAREQGGVIEITQGVMFARIYERGLLTKTSTEDGKRRLNPKKSILGTKRRFYHVRLSALFEHDA